MSLDVYLTLPVTEDEAEGVFWANITHNLNVMAFKAGIYHHLWRPEEIGIERAEQLIWPLSKGLAEMQLHPAYYRQFDAKNGWGLYEHFTPWIGRYMDACKEYPRALVEASR